MKKLIISGLAFAVAPFGQMAIAQTDSTQNAASAIVSAAGSQSALPWILVFTAIALGIVAIILGLLVGKVAILKLKGNKVAALAITFATVGALQAQTTTDMHWHLSAGAMNIILLSVIFLELLIILYFAKWLKTMIIPEQEKAEVVKTSAWWDKFNKSVAIEDEQDVQLDHNYDGIHELNNALPPWWLYGFYITIVFAGIYLWRYHVSHTAPSSYEELVADNTKAEAELKIALAKKGDLVDENSIEFKDDAAMIASGRELFLANCKVCHGENAEGLSGPNLTDQYWIHGGNIKDVFKTIRYGVLDKGMIAWGNTLSNKQIATLATYIKSIKTPVKGLPPKGELYVEDGAAAPAPATDSTATAAKTAQ